MALWLHHCFASIVGVAVEADTQFGITVAALEVCDYAFAQIRNDCAKFAVIEKNSLVGLQFGQIVKLFAHHTTI